jgi:hypothetical protein
MTTNNGSEYTKPKWKKNGTPEIIIGTAIISLISVDYYLQTQQDESRRDIMSTLQQTIRNDEQKEQKKDAEADSEAKVMESLFQCVVRKAPKFFDGSKSLMGIQIGDEVSVLKERVGPDGMYHLCRLEKKNEKRDSTAITVGWFPISCLEKLK